MAESTLLNHYNLTTLYPTEWPEEKDQDDDALDVDVTAQSNSTRPKYTSLQRGSSVRSIVPGSQRSKDGVETLVQKDEADPLGGADSVVRILRQRGLPVEEDSRLRRFLNSVPYYV